MNNRKLITLRGSESDETSWDVSPFEVGHVFWQPDEDVLSKRLDISYNKPIKLKVPLRLNPLILDLSRFTPTGVPVREHGAGELTFSVASYIEVELELVPNVEEIKIAGTERSVVIQHIIKVFQKAIQREFGVKLNVSMDEALSHMGLGTTPILMSAVVIGINELTGKPYSNRNLCKLVSRNYGEEFSLDKNLLVPGITTGGAFWSCLLGGANVTSGNFEHVFHAPLPEDLKLVVGLPRVREKQHAEKGFEIPIMDLVRKYDRFDAGKISYWVLMRLLPALIDQNIEKIGEVMWDITLNTDKAIPPIIKHNRFEIFDLLADLYTQGIEGGFISSAGPALGCLTTTSEKVDKIKQLFEKYQVELMEVFVDNKGLEVTPLDRASFND